MVRLLAKPAHPRARHGRALWTSIAFELWVQKFLDQSAAPKLYNLGTLHSVNGPRRGLQSETTFERPEPIILAAMPPLPPRKMRRDAGRAKPLRRPGCRGEKEQSMTRPIRPTLAYPR